MYYSKFRIRNFKGIRDTTITLSGQDKYGVIAFVGLNESGKTTILEAIHSFSPERATSELVGGGDVGVSYQDRVPRHLISNFTGSVSVLAGISISDVERADIIAELKEEHGIYLQSESVPNELFLERQQKFVSGDYTNSFFSLRAAVKIKTGRQKKWRAPETEEKTIIRDAIYNRTPDIAYFPTFVFDFPKRIFLTKERGDKVSKFYRQVFQDILDYDGKGHTIEDSIVRRIRSEEKKVSWLEFLSNWNSSDDRDKIQHVLDRASAAVTKVVFGRWNEIFGEDVEGKEIYISYDTLEGERREQGGAIRKTNEHDLYIKFQIKDGTRRFEVNDRSLGFRWFFAFMMFTQFRVAREVTRPILFLFDEPASNLHAAAQQKLIESFPGIARENHTLAYSTHSHYMIEPKWLEQTFIVTNRSDAPSGSVLDALSLSDESLDIQATKYNTFVNDHPNQTSYLQPVIDRLQVVPSRFDIDKASIIVEGKSDYYILRYAMRLLSREEVAVLPGFGAGTLGALIALHLGWGLHTVVLLDGDKKGVEERERYIQEYGLLPSKALALNEISSELKEIEDVLDGPAISVIMKDLELEKEPTKKQVRRYFQECLARDDIKKLSDYFEESVRTILNSLKEKMDVVQVEVDDDASLPE